MVNRRDLVKGAAAFTIAGTMTGRLSVSNPTLANPPQHGSVIDPQPQGALIEPKNMYGMTTPEDKRYEAVIKWEGHPEDRPYHHEVRQRTYDGSYDWFRVQRFFDNDETRYVAVDVLEVTNELVELTAWPSDAKLTHWVKWRIIPPHDSVAAASWTHTEDDMIEYVYKRLANEMLTEMTEVIEGYREVPAHYEYY